MAAQAIDADASPGLRASIAIVVTAAGSACALTLLWLGIRQLLDLSGPCDVGRCPTDVGGLTAGSVVGGVIVSALYVRQAERNRVPTFAGLIWPALCLSVAWNLVEYVRQADLPIAVEELSVVGALFLGLVGILPLVLALRAKRPREVAPALENEPVVSLESEIPSVRDRLDALRRSGALYRPARRPAEPLSGSGRFFWLTLQLLAIAGGIWFGDWFFEAATLPRGAP